MIPQKKISAIASSFNGLKYLPAFLENCSKQINKDQVEIVLVHNQPSEEEIKLVKAFQEKFPGLINHIVVPREPLAVSTNRALKAAKGEYVCIWNVDDLRTDNSLELMSKTLDENPKAGFTYGDFIIVHRWQTTQGRLVNCPEFEQGEFVKSMVLGPFYMWRSSLCRALGYWDEQFKSGADFDYAARLAVETLGQKTHGLLGYYLDEGLGLSTGKTPWQPIERTVVELRYGIYSKLDFWYYNRAIKYHLDQALQNGRWVPVVKLAPHYRRFAESRATLFFAALRYPVWLCQRAIKYALKNFKKKFQP